MHKTNTRGHKIKHIAKGVDTLIRNAKVQSYPATSGTTLYLCRFRNVLELLCKRARYPHLGIDMIQTASGLQWRVSVGNGIRLF